MEGQQQPGPDNSPEKKPGKRRSRRQRSKRAKPPENGGGKPGVSASRETELARELSRSDMQLIERALNKQYLIPEDELRITPLVMARIVAGQDNDGNKVPASRRDQIAAAKVLVAMRKLAVEQVNSKHQIGMLNPAAEEIKLIRLPLAIPPDLAGPKHKDEAPQ